MTLEHLYIPDPFTHNTLKPQNCYIEFPYWRGTLFPEHSKLRKSTDDYWVPVVSQYRPFADEPNALGEWLASQNSTAKEFTKTKDGLNFRLELAGFAKEDLSVTINDKALIVKSLNTKNPYSKGFVIPNAENYNLANPTAQMSNGLLEISFAAKKRRSSGD